MEEPDRGSPRAAPLEGIRVLDLTRVLSGPHCTRTLCDLGAEIIKVEPPEGDMVRFQAPRRHGMPAYFAQQNVGKRCISIDLGVPAGRDLLLDLVAHCDVVVENFRPGVLDRLGVGYDALRDRRPDVILLSISGYGQTGPWRDRMAYASVVGAECGLTKIQGDARGGDYRNDPNSHADVYTALEGAVAILAALHQRGRTGAGQHIDVSMAETMLYVNELAQDQLWDGPDDPNWVRSFGTEHQPVVETADGSRAQLAAHPAQNGVFEMVTAMLGRVDLRDDPRFASVAARKQHLDELLGLLRDFAANVTDADTLIEICQVHGIAAGRLRSVRELADSEWAAERGAIAAIDDRGGGTLRIPNAPWHFSAAPDVGVRGTPRFRGEDNASVLAQLLGLDEVAVDALTAAGALSTQPRSAPR